MVTEKGPGLFIFRADGEDAGAVVAAEGEKVFVDQGR